MLKSALDTQVVTVRNGTRRRLTKREIVVAQLIDKCAEADLRATKLLLDMLHKLERSAAATPATPASSGPNADVYEQLRAKLARLALAQAAEARDAEPLDGSGDALPDLKEDDR